MSIVARTEDSDYSPTWKWVDDEELVGTHVEFRRASTEYGEVVVWELDSDEHGRVSVWLEPTNLVARVQGELARRKAKLGEPRLEQGERVRLNPGVKRPSKKNPKQSVWPFPAVEFEHSVPDTSAEEFLLSGVVVEPEDGESALEAAAAPPIPEHVEETLDEIVDEITDENGEADDGIPF